ncbi:MAG: hypothetical protein AAF573_11540 [Bacteroidota bacterium]
MKQLPIILTLVLITLNGEMLISQDNQSDEIPDVILEFEEDIDIEPTQLSPKIRIFDK